MQTVSNPYQKHSFGQNLTYKKSVQKVRINYTYGFNGMEKDDEIKGSGNQYIAMFWEYSPRLGKRWNIDPVVKHHESPYAAFANNPIWFIDPNGADTVEIFADGGRLSNHIEAKGDDVFFLLDKDGNRGESISFGEGTLESIRTQSTSYKEDGKEKVGSIDIYKLRGDENSTKLFEFMANNTGVEWSQFMTGKAGDNGLNFLTTTGLKAKEAGAVDLYAGQLYAGYSVRAHIHSHPYNPFPSGLDEGDKDIGFAKWLEDDYMSRYTGRAKPVFKIFFVPSGEYVPYSKDSKREDFIKPTELPAIEITPK
jgi:RHS repeat-associated protein